MSNAVLKYGDLGLGSFEEHPKTSDELVARLDELRDKYSQRAEAPYGVDIVRSGVGVLSAGLGNGSWILMFTSEDGSNTLMSLGDRDADGAVQFFFGDVSLLSRKYLVPREHALQVVRNWFDHAELGNAIDWTDEIFWV